MANNLTANPLILDTAGTLVVTCPIQISKIHWAIAPASGSITLSDRSGKVVYKTTIIAGATAHPADSDFLPLLNMDGLTVAVTGTIEVHVHLANTPIPVKTT
jgi:hypothetical protein